MHFDVTKATWPRAILTHMCYICIFEHMYMTTFTPNLFWMSSNKNKITYCTTRRSTARKCGNNFDTTTYVRLHLLSQQCVPHVHKWRGKSKRSRDEFDSVHTSLYRFVSSPSAKLRLLPTTLVLTALLPSSVSKT